MIKAIKRFCIRQKIKQIDSEIQKEYANTYSLANPDFIDTMRTKRETLQNQLTQLT